MPERDLFANFDRMRRDMDELLGLSGQRVRGFSPAVDVAYASDPPRAIVTAELAGVDVEKLQVETQGRSLILAGIRSGLDVEGDVYQQVEIERGPFRRIVELEVDVRAEDAKASYENGMLRIELPLARPQPRARTVRIESAEQP
jgi:HSP20 family protein